MALAKHDLALLSARFATARFGASRFGFIPCPEDVHGLGTDEPGEYVWKEEPVASQEEVTEWTLQQENCVCRDLCTLALGPPLKAYWKLDEESGTRVDSVGDYDLEPVNAPGFTAGQIDNAATFNNASSQQLVGPFVPIDASRGVTVVAWVNVRTGAPAGAAMYFLNGTGFFGAVGLGNNGVSALTMAFTVSNAAGNSAVASVTLGAHDTWYLVVGKYDPDTQVASISVDAGAFTAGTTLVGDHPDCSSGNAYIGGWGTWVSKSYMDEVGLFNEVLSQDEIDSIEALERPPHVAAIVDEPTTLTYIVTGVLGLVGGEVRINWGDGGHERRELDLIEEGDEIEFSHTYLETGVYAVTVLLHDERGCTVTATSTITVGEAEPPVDCLDLAITAEAAEDFPTEATFDSTTTGGTGPFTYEWRFWSDEPASDSSVNNPIWVKTTEDAVLSNAELDAEVAEHGPWCSGQYRVTVTDTDTGCTAFFDGTWQYNCV
jgi:hypothetical protein